MLAELVLAALLGVSHCLLMFDRVDSENACLLAMCDADSGCVPKGCSIDQNNRIGCGYFRLNIYQFRESDIHILQSVFAFQQCYQPGKKEDEDEEEAWINCAEDYGCSSECIRVRRETVVYWWPLIDNTAPQLTIQVLGSRFRVKCYGKSDCETLARIHDGGANGCRDR
ncbi:unnamed protein product [Heligmosomoides polygyrus]|uniref:lysozyme n=1 Tax=Heligmosomoides polygyrus TaxID=6339 RepID=A0A183GML0_HELPZ|nr:unnamed protein product [Heligmosomoides polygyrus]